MREIVIWYHPTKEWVEHYKCVSWVMTTRLALAARFPSINKAYGLLVSAKANIADYSILEILR